MEHLIRKIKTRKQIEADCGFIESYKVEIKVAMQTGHVGNSVFIKVEPGELETEGFFYELVEPLGRSDMPEILRFLVNKM